MNDLGFGFPPGDEAIEGALAGAIEADALDLLYQPKFSLKTGRLAGAEALMRWEDAELGVVGPDRFIPIAERNGLIDALTTWGLARALARWRTWREQGIVAELAFNISAATLRDINFPDAVQRMCMEVGVPPEMLTLELTEGATQEAVNLMDTLSRVRIKGMRTALDDFGTGYSSLLQLRRLPFCELKIDRWFVEDSTRSPAGKLVIRSIIDLAHGLGLTVTAEGVATPEQFDLLHDLGCDQVQGEFISPPIAGDRLAPWLLSRGEELSGWWGRNRGSHDRTGRARDDRDRGDAPGSLSVHARAAM